MYSNNQHLHTPTSLPAPRPRPHPLDQNWRFPPPPQPDFSLHQPQVYPHTSQFSHQRTNTLQLSSNISNYQPGLPEMPMLSASEKAQHDEGQSAHGMGSSSLSRRDLPRSTTIHHPQPQPLTPGMTPPPFVRAWTLDSKTSRSPLALAPTQCGKPNARSSLPLRFPHAESQASMPSPPSVSSTPRTPNQDGRAQERWLAIGPNTFREPHASGERQELSEKMYRGLRGRVGGPPRAVLGGPGGKTFDQMMAEKDRKHASTKFQNRNISGNLSVAPSSRPASGSGPESSSYKSLFREEPCMWKGNAVVVRMPYKSYSPPDSPSNLSDSVEYDEEVTDPIPHRPRKEAFPWPSSKVRLSPEAVPLPISPNDITHEDLGEAMSDLSFRSEEGEGSATWDGKKVFVRIPDSDRWECLSQERLARELEREMAPEQDVSMELENEGEELSTEEENGSIEEVENAIPADGPSAMGDHSGPKDDSMSLQFTSPADSLSQTQISQTIPPPFESSSLAQNSIRHDKKINYGGAMNNAFVRKQLSGLFRQSENTTERPKRSLRASSLKMTGSMPLSSVDYNSITTDQRSDSQASPSGTEGQSEKRPKGSKMRAWSDAGEFEEGESGKLEVGKTEDQHEAGQNSVSEHPHLEVLAGHQQTPSPTQRTDTGAEEVVPSLQAVEQTIPSVVSPVLTESHIVRMSESYDAATAVQPQPQSTTEKELDESRFVPLYGDAENGSTTEGPLEQDIDQIDARMTLKRSRTTTDPSDPPSRPAPSLSSIYKRSMRLGSGRRGLRPTAATFTPSQAKTFVFEESKGSDLHDVGHERKASSTLSTTESTAAKELRPTAPTFVPTLFASVFQPETTFTFAMPYQSEPVSREESKKGRISAAASDFVPSRPSSFHTHDAFSPAAESQIRATAPSFTPRGSYSTSMSGTSSSHTPSMSTSTTSLANATKIRATAAVFVPASSLGSRASSPVKRDGVDVDDVLSGQYISPLTQVVAKPRKDQRDEVSGVVETPNGNLAGEVTGHTARDMTAEDEPSVMIVRREATPLPSLDPDKSLSSLLAMHESPSSKVLMTEADRIARPAKAATRHEHNSHRPRALPGISISTDDIGVPFEDIVIHPSKPVSSHHTTPSWIEGGEGKDIGFPDVPHTASTHMMDDVESILWSPASPIGCTPSGEHKREHSTEVSNSTEGSGGSGFAADSSGSGYSPDFPTRTASMDMDPTPRTAPLHLEALEQSELITDHPLSAGFATSFPVDQHVGPIMSADDMSMFSPLTKRSENVALSDENDSGNLSGRAYPVRTAEEKDSGAYCRDLTGFEHQSLRIVSTQNAPADESTYYDADSEVVTSVPTVSHSQEHSFDMDNQGSLTDSHAAYPRQPSDACDASEGFPIRREAPELRVINDSPGHSLPSTVIAPSSPDKIESDLGSPVQFEGSGVLRILEVLRKQDEISEKTSRNLNGFRDEVLDYVRDIFTHQASNQLVEDIAAALSEQKNLLELISEAVSRPLLTPAVHPDHQQDRPQELFVAILSSQHAILSKFDEVSSSRLESVEEADRMRAEAADVQSREIGALTMKLNEVNDHQVELRAELEVYKQRLKDSRRERDELRGALDEKETRLEGAVLKKSRVEEEMDRLVARALAAELERDALAKYLTQEKEEQDEVERERKEMLEEIETIKEMSRLALLEKENLLAETRSVLQETQQTIESERQAALQPPPSPPPPLATASALTELSTSSHTFRTEVLDRMDRLDDIMQRTMGSRDKEHEDVLEQNRELIREVENLRAKLETSAEKHSSFEKDLDAKVQILEAKDEYNAEKLQAEVQKREEAEKETEVVKGQMARLQEQMVRWQIEVATKQSQASMNEIRLQTLAQENTYWREFALNADRRRLRSYISTRPLDGETPNSSPEVRRLRSSGQESSPLSSTVDRNAPAALTPTKSQIGVSGSPKIHAHDGEKGSI